MTKLTVLKGASDLLPDIDNNYNSHIRTGYLMAKDRLDSFHLSVDVEAMALEIARSVFGHFAKTKESIPESLWNDYMNFAKHLSKTQSSWARLVRE